MSNQRFLISRPTIADKLTVADTYAIVPITENGTAKNYWDTWHLNGKAMRFAATTQNLLVKILGSLGGTEDADFTETVEAEFSVAVGAPVKKDIAGLWVAIQVLVKPASSGQNGTLSTKAFGSSLADAGNAILDSMDGKLPAKGSATMAGAIPVTLATDGPGVANLVTLAGAIKAEDAIHSSGDSGIMMLGVRKDSAAAIAGSDGDYISPTFDQNGAMYVNPMSLGYDKDTVGAYLLSQLPYGATFVRVAADGAAGVAVTASMPAVSGKTNHVLGWYTNVDVAATGAIVTAILKDNTTAMGTKVINTGAAVGTEVGATPSSAPVAICSLGNAANLVVSAPSGSTVMHACIWGYYI
jgi:hypothetical protein